MRRFVQFAVLSVLACTTLSVHASGLSTNFVEIVVESVKVGKEVKVYGPEGKGLILRNLGEEPIQVFVQALRPESHQLRPGADPMPELQWVRLDPPTVLIPPHGEREVKVTVTVPRLKQFRNRLFQVMIWSRGEAVRKQGISYNAALLSNLRIHTLP